jgi:hypothetical protein
LKPGAGGLLTVIVILAGGDVDCVWFAEVASFSVGEKHEEEEEEEEEEENARANHTLAT